MAELQDARTVPYYARAPHRLCVLEASRDGAWGAVCANPNDPSPCPATEAARGRTAAMAEGGGAWGRLELRRESGGLRHYLDGRPVHSGYHLVLQGVAHREDAYGEFTVPVQVEHDVRYETLVRGLDGFDADLFVVVGGHTFRAPLEAWMRFRWRDIAKAPLPPARRT